MAGFGTIVGPNVEAGANDLSIVLGPESQNRTCSAETFARLEAYAAARFPTIRNPDYDADTVPEPPLTIPNPAPLQSLITEMFEILGGQVASWEHNQNVASVPAPPEFT